MWRGLRGERLKLSDKVDTLSQIVRATRDEAEVVAAPSPPPTVNPAQANGHAATSEIGGRENWEIIRTDWRNVRDRIDLLIEGIRRSSTRSKYSHIPRYSYIDVINELRNDKLIKVPVWHALVNMDRCFHKLKSRPEKVKPADVSDFKSQFNVVDKVLPELPEPAVVTEQPQESTEPSGMHQAA